MNPRLLKDSRNNRYYHDAYCKPCLRVENRHNRKWWKRGYHKVARKRAKEALKEYKRAEHGIPT